MLLLPARSRTMFRGGFAGVLGICCCLWDDDGRDTGDWLARMRGDAGIDNEGDDDDGNLGDAPERWL